MISNYLINCTMKMFQHLICKAQSVTKYNRTYDMQMDGNLLHFYKTRVLIKALICKLHHSLKPTVQKVLWLHVEAPFSLLQCFNIPNKLHHLRIRWGCIRYVPEHTTLLPQGSFMGCINSIRLRSTGLDEKHQESTSHIISLNFCIPQFMEINGLDSNTILIEEWWLLHKVNCFVTQHRSSMCLQLPY